MVMLLNLSKRYLNSRLLITLFFIIVLILITGCQKEEAVESVTIFAAASLTNAVTDIVSDYQLANEGQKLLTNFAGSKTLRAQLENGAEGDIFISANEKHYRALLDQDILLEGQELLSNHMVLVVSSQSDVRIKTLEDLTVNHNLILAEEGVPAGDYARKVLGNLNALYGETYADTVLLQLASTESNVRQVLTKVALGEGDAALVYKTDITEDVIDKVRVIEIPEGYNVFASYWIALVNNDTIEENVHACYELLLEVSSDQIFENYGFTVVE